MQSGSGGQNTRRPAAARALGWALLLMMAVVLGAPGCAAPGPDLAEQGVVALHATPAEDFQQRPRVRAEDGELIVSGRVRRAGGRSGPGGVVSVRVVEAGGGPVASADLPFRGFPRGVAGVPGPTGGSHRPAPRRSRPIDSFEVRLPVALRPGLTVELTHTAKDTAGDHREKE